MVEHTTDYSTDVIKMTVYSASWATIVICKSCKKMNKMHTPGIYCLEKYKNRTIGLTKGRKIG